MGAGTRYQRALGITDDADALFYEYMSQYRQITAKHESTAIISGSRE